MFAKIEIKKQRIGYRVRVDNKWQSGLTPDESLGVVAHALYSNDETHIFLRDQKQWKNLRRHYRDRNKARLQNERRTS